MSISICKLLEDITAADQAHQKGYKSVGFDKWAKDGKVVARTVNGKLVPVQDDETGHDDVAPKPTTMSAKDAGTKPSNMPTPMDAAKTAGNAVEKKPDGKDGKEADGPHKAPRNLYGVQPFPVGRPVEDYDLADEIAVASDPHEFTKTINTDEETYILSNDDWDDYFVDEIDVKDLQAVKDMGAESSVVQHKEWRDILPRSSQFALMERQIAWQSNGQFYSDPEIREERNAEINLIANGKPTPATLHNVGAPIERGMLLHKDVLHEFINTFAVGEDIDMPPSGFSFSPNFARAVPFWPRSSAQVGILIRMAPNRDGDLHGIALAHLSPDAPYSKPDGNQKGFNHELEVIRYSGPKARCTSIRKLITPPHSIFDHIRVAYVIELEERGFGPDPLDEAKKKKIITNTVFERIMNTPVRQVVETKESIKEAKLTKLITMLEGKASDTAHQLGLTYKGHSYWMDKSGKTVAMTKDDVLVKLSPEVGAKLDADINIKPDWMEDDGWRGYTTVDHLGPYNGEAIDLYDGTQTKGQADNLLHKMTGKATGTNPGGFFQGKDGINRYVKFYDDSGKTYGEVLSNNIYHDLGFNAPESQYFDNQGMTAFASVIVPNVGELADVGLTQPLAHKILDGFAADCLVANWDVVGVNEGYMRNIVVTAEGDVCRIDNGGSMLCRGLSGRKPEAVLNKCDELTFFVNGNPSYAEVFAKVGYKSAADLGDRFIQQVTDILKMVTEAGGWEEYINMKVPDLKGADHDKMVAMLYHRTKLLMEYAKQVKLDQAIWGNKK